MKTNPPRGTALLAALSFAILGLAPAALAQIVVTTGTSAPTGDILFQSQNISGTGALGWQWTTTTPSNKRDLLQQFYYIPSDFEIDTISLFTAGSYLIPAGLEVGFTLTINTYASASSATPLSTVATYNGTLTRRSSGNLWWSFDIPDTELSAGTLYGFTLSFSEAANASNVISWQTFTGPNPFPNAGFAQINYNTGSPVATFVNGDLNFIVQGTTVPEPSTAAMLLIPGMALVLRRRRN